MNNTPDFSWMFVKMILGLVFVLGLALFLVRYVLPRTKLGRNRKDSWIKIIDRAPLDRGLSLYLVKIVGKYLVLGASEAGISQIADISNEEGQKIEGD